MACSIGLFYYSMLFVFCLSVDRISKWLVLNNIDMFPIEISSNLRLSVIWNKGVTWGMFNSISSESYLLMISVILLVILVFVFYTFIQYQNKFNIAFESMVLAGSISNIMDRFFYGSVLDFINFYIDSWSWPIFNFADVFIVVGILGIVIRNILCLNH